ncbi:MAG: hypothetical protein ACLU0B_00540 [Lachnospiraceae bacterium]
MKLEIEMRKMDAIYKRICEKLGCEPKDIAIPNFDTEDDSWESPFKILTVEEIDYLYENGYLNQK